MSYDLKEMFSKMSQGELSAHSELGTRDENKQSKNYSSRIQKMKLVTGINARIMPFKDLVIPFNPFTGKVDEVYNDKTPFRPILLVSQAITGIKGECEKNPELKAFWEDKLEITLTPGPATMDEYAAFRAKGFIMPRIMTYSTVALNFGGSYGFPDFRVKYSVPPEQLNESGSYDYNDAPVWHLAAIFFNSMLRPEADKVEKDLKASGQNKDTIKAQRQAVFAKSPVGFVGPTNLIPFLYFPLNEPPKKLDPSNYTDLESVMRFYSKTDKWTTALAEAMKDPIYDTTMDYYDLTIKTPSSSDTKADNSVYTDEDAMELYTAMIITNTDGRRSLTEGKTEVNGQAVPNTQVFANVYEAAEAYFANSQEQSFTEGGETFEKIMATSNKFRPITSIMDNFLPACNEVFSSTFAGTSYFNDNIKKANAPFFTMLNPANAFALADEDEEDLEAAREGQKDSVMGLIKEAQEAALAAEGDGGDIGTLELE